MLPLLAVALCLAPQTTRQSAPAAPAAPGAPQHALRRLFTYDPLVYQLHIPGGAFHELELGTPDGPERFGLYVPAVPASTASPLLVHFHAFNGGHTDLLHFATGMLEEADARGWFLVAPDQSVRNAQGQADGRTYGGDEAQRRVQAVLDWALAALPIDRTRVYGYGFSMGGGDVLSYAAQHLDPTRGAFAAVINHTGTLVLTEEWTRSFPSRHPLESVFSGTPAVASYAYRRASTIAYPWSPTAPSAFTGAGQHPARNLELTPTRSWYHVGDSGFARAREFMSALDTLVIDHAIEERPTIPGSPAHAWEYLDPVEACDWLAQHALTVPWSGTVIAARDARYHDLELRRKTTSAFGELTFSLPPGDDTISITGVSNVLEVRVDVVRSQLDAQSGELDIELGRDTHPSYAGRAVVLEVANLGYVPQTVLQLNASPSEQPLVMHGNGFVRILSRATGTTVDHIVVRRQ